MAGVLLHPLARVEDRRLPAHLVLQGPLHRPEGVEVFHLGPLRKLGLAKRPQRDVGVAAQAPLLHLAVGDARVKEDRAQLFHKEPGLFGRAQIRLGDDLDQRDAAPVVVDQAVLGAHDVVARVDRLARFFLQVYPGDSAPGAARRSPQTPPTRCGRSAGRIARSDTPWAGRGRSSFSDQTC